MKTSLAGLLLLPWVMALDRKSTRLNSSHSQISYAVFCLKKKKESHRPGYLPTDHPRQLLCWREWAQSIVTRASGRSREDCEAPTHPSTSDDETLLHHSIN